MLSLNNAFSAEEVEVPSTSACRDGLGKERIDYAWSRNSMVWRSA
jgi:hypothetical protein